MKQYLSRFCLYGFQTYLSVHTSRQIFVAMYIRSCLLYVCIFSYIFEKQAMNLKC